MTRHIDKISAIGLFVIAVLWFGAGEASAQRMPERRMVRSGNRQYNRGNYQRSIERYEQALQKDSTLFEAIYDLGNALSHTDNAARAEQMLLRAAMDTSRSDEERAEAFFNLGDVQFRQQNLKGALESFKNSLRLNPSDMEAKYNYAYTKKLLEQQEQEQNDDQNNRNDQNNQNNQNNQDNQDNENNEKNNDRNQDNQDNGGGDDNNGDGQDEQPSDGEGQEREGDGRQHTGISPEQAEAMLEAIQAQEDKTQDKVKEKQGVIVRGKKNW